MQISLRGTTGCASVTAASAVRGPSAAASAAPRGPRRDEPLLARRACVDDLIALEPPDAVLAGPGAVTDCLHSCLLVIRPGAGYPWPHGDPRADARRRQPARPRPVRRARALGRVRAAAARGAGLPAPGARRRRLLVRDALRRRRPGAQGHGDVLLGGRRRGADRAGAGRRARGAAQLHGDRSAAALAVAPHVRARLHAALALRPLQRVPARADAHACSTRRCRRASSASSRRSRARSRSACSATCSACPTSTSTSSWSSATACSCRPTPT